MGYRRGLIPPQYPEPTVTPEKRLTLLDAIGDLISDSEKKAAVNPVSTQYQLDSFYGRTPAIDGKPIAAKHITNTELPKQTDIVRERFELFQPGESGTYLKRRIMEEGIDISDKPNLIAMCSKRLGISASEVVDLFGKSGATREQAEVLLTKKNIRQRFAPHQPSATVVTIADDYISPWEPRTFSVREMARCQSFDDSFEFLGKRTTGGLLRRKEVPQYTQVGNAVPPLLSKSKKHFNNLIK